MKEAKLLKVLDRETARLVIKELKRIESPFVTSEVKGEFLIIKYCDHGLKSCSFNLKGEVLEEVRSFIKNLKL